MMADFSLLPAVAWVDVMKYLPLADRYHLSQTCQALNDVFNHASVWYTVDITLLGAISRYSDSEVIIPDRYYEMVKRFGEYFQDLTLNVMYFYTRLPEKCQLVLDALSSNCRLRTLTLSCGTIITKRDIQTQQARNIGLDHLANIVARSVRMQRFVLKSWPMYSTVVSKVDILNELCSNEHIQELETLSLFWQDASQTSWTTLNAQLPSADSILATVQHFRHLKSLCVRSTMLSNKVIQELASHHRKQLTTLGVLLTYSRQEPNGNIPEIACSSWDALKTKSPSIGVDVTVVTRTPYDNLHSFLKPELPLTSISFMKYSHCGRDDLSAITDKYNVSLCKFADYSDGENCDNHLVGLVTRCKNMNSFQYFGKLHYSTVLHLARLRAKKWHHFQVNFDNITTHGQDTDYDDNQVIVRRPDGSVDIVDSRTGDADEKLLDTMVKEVGQIIGQIWQPMNRKMVEKKMNIVDSNIGIVPLKVAMATEAEASGIN